MVSALDKLGVLDKIFECASIHRDTKDVLDSATSLMKTIYKRGVPILQNPTAMCVHGLVHVFRTKGLVDEECSTACIETMARLCETTFKTTSSAVEKRRELDEHRQIDGKLWEHIALSNMLLFVSNLLAHEKDCMEGGGGSKIAGAVLGAGGFTGNCLFVCLLLSVGLFMRFLICGKLFL